MLANLRYIHTDTYAVCVEYVCVCAVCTASCLGVSLCFAIRLAKFAIKRNSMSLAYNWQSPSQRQKREREGKRGRQTTKRYKDTFRLAERMFLDPPAAVEAKVLLDKMFLNFLSLIFRDSVCVFRLIAWIVISPSF